MDALKRLVGATPLGKAPMKVKADSIHEGTFDAYAGPGGGRAAATLFPKGVYQGISVEAHWTKGGQAEYEITSAEPSLTLHVVDSPKGTLLHIADSRGPTVEIPVPGAPLEAPGQYTAAPANSLKIKTQADGQVKILFDEDVCYWDDVRQYQRDPSGSYDAWRNGDRKPPPPQLIPPPMEPSPITEADLTPTRFDTGSLLKNENGVLQIGGLLFEE